MPGRRPRRGQRPGPWAPWISRAGMAALMAMTAPPGLGIPAVAAPRASTAAPGGQEALVRLLEKGRCPGCQLQEADLVHADLRRVNLEGADLRHANLSRARLEGANLRGADLRQTALRGAQLQGADLRGAQMGGTDLREAQLDGTALAPRQLSLSHWQGARGLNPALLTYADLHNAGVRAALGGAAPEAERWFSQAIGRQPEAAISWVARGVSRSEQGNLSGAAQDFRAAAQLLQAGGDAEQAKVLVAAASQLEQRPKAGEGGNGVGSQLLGGALAVFQFLAPIAAKALIPMAL